MTDAMVSSLVLLLSHGLVSVALLGAISHQCVAVVRPAGSPTDAFFDRYRSVSATLFPSAVVLLYLVSFGLGGVLYPEYRLESRYALEEMGLLFWVGMFELKEHFAAIGLGVLPLYRWHWRDSEPSPGRGTVTLLLGGIVWFNFLVGHVLNNYRGV